MNPESLARALSACEGGDSVSPQSGQGQEIFDAL